jgi:hypothetical protein
VEGAVGAVVGRVGGAGAVTTGGVVATGGAAGAGGAAVVAVAGRAPGCGSFVRSTNATANAAKAKATETAAITTGTFQRGVGATRVRAARPHSRHQSASGGTAAPQRAQRMVPSGGVAGAGAGASGAAGLTTWAESRRLR